MDYWLLFIRYSIVIEYCIGLLRNVYKHDLTVYAMIRKLGVLLAAGRAAMPDARFAECRQRKYGYMLYSEHHDASGRRRER